MQYLDDLHASLCIFGGAVQRPRGPQPGSPLLSSMGGRFLLKAAISAIESYQWSRDFAGLGCYLLGVTIACHGFPDANGRTGRVLYAILQCEASEDYEFNAPTAAAEQELTDLSLPIGARILPYGGNRNWSF